MPKFSQDRLGTSNNYHEWLGQHESCYDINIWSSLLEFRNASNAWSSVWKAWASIFNNQESDWKARPQVLKQMLVWVFCQQEFRKTWSVKSPVYSLESNLINYSIFNLHFTNNSWSHSFRHCALGIPIGCISYLNVDLVVNICKRKTKSREKMTFMTVCKISEVKANVWN